MVQPAVRIRSAHEAVDAARSLESPAEVEQFEEQASSSAAIRAFLASEEWPTIRARIMGDGRPPTGRPQSVSDLARLYRWAADGAISSGHITTAEERRVYLHCAAEAEGLERTLKHISSTSPVSAPPAAPAAANKTTGLSFGEAMTAVRAGAHITRSAWPGGSYVTAQAGYPQGIAVNANTAAATGLEQGTTAVFRPYLIRRLPQLAPVVDDGKFVDLPPEFEHWTPAQSDMFADDWRVLPRP